MAKCDYCGSFLIFSGKKDGNLKFCNDECHAHGYVLNVADQIPADILCENVIEVHSGNCPKCGKAGPVDVHTSHSIWSAFILSSWKSKPDICCHSCGIKNKIGGMLFSGVFGWWGFPWGIIMTPIQVGRNFFGLFHKPDPARPSSELENIVKVHMAQHAIAAAQEQHNKTQAG